MEKALYKCTTLLYFYKGDGACVGVEAESEESLGADAAWLDHTRQGVSHCKAHSVFPWLVEALSLPVECVVVLLQGARVCQPCFLKGSNVHIQPLKLVVDDGCFSGVVDLS